jgi:hypothetical protein
MSCMDEKAEIEVSRRERLKELKGSPEAAADLAKALRTASAVMKAVDDHLAGDLTITSDPELYRWVYGAFENLFELNQALGDKQRRSKAYNERGHAHSALSRSG